MPLLRVLEEVKCPLVGPICQMQSCHVGTFSPPLSNPDFSLVIVHGLVRFDFPQIEDGRSYLVEPQFSKRSDPKSAVALLAISQNVGGWIHDIMVAIENLITPDMRTKTASLVGPLYQECTRARIP
jgi:hypothetical protein